MKNNWPYLFFPLLSGVLLSIPWLVPHSGLVALIGFVPLLIIEDMAIREEQKHFFLYQYSGFILWNALTTFWVCNATVGGGIFAVFANALQMALIFQLFHISRRYMKSALPYLFLAFMWIAWEKMYLGAEISWPWLLLGNAFAGSTSFVQWYEITGSLGGSLWMWAVNLAIYGLISNLADGSFGKWRPFARFAALFGFAIILSGPIVASELRYHNYEETGKGSVNVLVGQPNYDPYEKFSSMRQEEQTAGLLNLYKPVLSHYDSAAPVLLLAPETFTGDVVLNDVEDGATWKTFAGFLSEHPACKLLFGASTYDITFGKQPSPLARPYLNGWLRSHNSAILLGSDGGYEVYHKSRLVVGTELTPYPAVFVPVDDFLSSKMGVSGLLGRCEGQEEASVLHFSDSAPIGCAVCYESVYGDYCAEYVRKGAKALAVITNDAWWGDTPGYRQHCAYSRLRAIESRRDVARCGNTGISCFINQRGDVVSSTPWWTRTVLSGKVNLNSHITPFVQYGDVVGRVSIFIFLILAAYLLVRILLSRGQGFAKSSSR